MKKAKIGILTLSDRASAGIYEDISGKSNHRNSHRISHFPLGKSLLHHRGQPKKVLKQNSYN